MRYLFLYVFLFLIPSLYGQHLPYINYTTHRGLPQIQTHKLHQDQKGYIWIGTKGGLAKFNGENFERFLRGQYINKVEEAPNGEIFVVTHKGIYRYHCGKMQLFHKNDMPTSVLAGEDRQWIFNKKNIYEIKEKDTLKHYKTNLYFNRYEYFNYYDWVRKIPFFDSSTRPNCLQYIENQELKSLCFDGKIILKQFENGSVYVLEQKGNHYRAMDPFTKKLFFEFDKSDAQFRNFAIYSLPVETHIFSFHGSAYYKLIQNQPTKEIVFPFIKSMYDLKSDKDGNYWATTDNGLYQIANGALQVFPRTYMNDIWTLVKGKDGHFYGAEYENALYQLDFEQHTKKELPVFRTDGVRERDFYYGASKDIVGNLYFPSHYGVYQYDYKSFTKLNNEVCLITKYDSIHQQIIAGQSHGLIFFDKNGVKSSFTDTSKKLITGQPTDFLIKNKNEIWIASWKSLAVFDRENRTFNKIDKYYKNMPNEGMICFAQDYKQNVWLGSTAGLWFFNDKTKSFKKIKPNLIDSNILSIKSFEDKYLIFGTSHELFVMDLQRFYQNQQVYFKVYNFRNGFIGEEIAQNGIYLSDRKLYIPSTTYTSVLDIDKIDLKQEFFNVLVTEINDQGLSLAQQNGTKFYDLPKNVHNVEINFESVGFGLPTSSKFQYFLEGVDKAWSPWSEKQKVVYANLGSGTYTFHVKASNGSFPGKPIVKESKVVFNVSLPFYMEPNFYKYGFFFSILITLLAGYAIWKAYQNRIKVQHRERKIKLLEIATLQAQINPHFIFNFLSSIQGLINKESPEKANNYLVKFSRLVRAYMESSIRSSKILSGHSLGNENTIKEEIDLLSTYLELEKMKYPEGKINYEFQIEDSSIYSKTIPPMMLQPFVENAIKHGILPKNGPGKITLTFLTEGEKLYCIITDNGIGRKMAEELKEQAIHLHKSRGLQLIKNRVEMLNELGYYIRIDFEDPKEGGTVVKIIIQS